MLQNGASMFCYKGGDSILQTRLHSTMPRFGHNLLKRRVQNQQLVPSASLFKLDMSKIPKEDPEKGKLVYLGTLASMVRLVKAFSVSTSMMGICVQPYLYQHASELPIALTVMIGGALSFFIFLTPLMLHIITKRYITKMYYNEDTGKFTATSYTFFVNEKDTQFSCRDITVPEVPGLFTTVKVNRKPIFLDPSMFLEREAYIRIMGYDKPMDWKMYQDEKKAD